MIPYFKIPSLPLFGPLELQPFGVLVAIGILVGSWFAQRRAEEEKIDLQEIRNAVAWAVVAGFIGAHWVAIIFYFPERIIDEGPLVLLKLWSGISSFGGFLGALVGLVGYYGYKRKPWLHIAEIILQALVVGWIFGRLACTVAYDHPGQPTDFFLGHEYRDGVVRYNLGLYEFLYTLLVIFPLMLWAYSKKPRRGVIIGLVCVLYAPVRFGLDFLRSLGNDFDHFTNGVMLYARGDTIFGHGYQSFVNAVSEVAGGGLVRRFPDNGLGSDLRYAGLTPGQYLAIGVLLLGLIMFYRSKSQPAIGTPVPGSEPEEPAPKPKRAPSKAKGKGGGGQRSNKGKKKRR